MIGFRPSIWWKICWCYITPFTIMVSVTPVWGGMRGDRGGRIWGEGGLLDSVPVFGGRYVGVTSLPSLSWWVLPQYEGWDKGGGGENEGDGGGEEWSDSVRVFVENLLVGREEGENKGGGGIMGGKGGGEIGFRPSIWWKICWCYITPFTIMVSIDTQHGEGGGGVNGFCLSI